MPEPRVPDKSHVRCRIVPARPNDVCDFASHLARHLEESGRDGSLHFGVTRGLSREQLEDTIDDRWVMPVHLVGWSRAWLLWEGEPRAPIAFAPPSSVAPHGRVVGHAELRGPSVSTALHRALFSVGVERAFVGLGYGAALLEEAVRWAKAEPTLEWLDLQVFASNGPAIALYEKAGFITVGRTPDAYRMDDGTRIDDVHMVLSLRASP